MNKCNIHSNKADVTQMYKRCSVVHCPLDEVARAGDDGRESRVLSALGKKLLQNLAEELGCSYTFCQWEGDTEGV